QQWTSVVSSKEISSTEKLLQAIRNKPQSSQDSDSEIEARPVDRWSRIKSRLPGPGAKEIIGVDLLPHAAGLVRMQSSRQGLRAEQAMHVPLPQELYPGHPDLPQFLQEHIQALGPSRKAVLWANLPPAGGEILNIKVPAVKRGLTDAVYWSARREKAFDPQEYTFDYRVQGEVTEQGARKLLVEVCLARTSDVTRYRGIFQNLGYSLQGLTLPALALENIFRQKWLRTEYSSCAVLHIAEECSSIIILDEQRIFLSRVIKTGRDSILEELVSESAAQVSVDLSQAEDMQESGLDLDAISSKEQAANLLGSAQASHEDPEAESELDFQQVLLRIQPALQRLARQLERTMDHYVNVLQHNPPEGLYICGELAALPGLADFFQEQLGLETSFLNALDQDLPGMSPFLADLSRQERSSLAVATGLAQPCKQGVNFLYTAREKDQEKKALRNANAVAVGCACLFALAAGYWWQLDQELEQSRQEKAELEQKLNSYSPRLDTEMLTQIGDKLQNRQQDLREYSRRMLSAAAVTEVNSVTPEHISLLSLELDTGDEPNQDSEQKQSGMLILQGFIQGDAAEGESRLTSYILRLQRSELFKQARIENSSSDTLQGKEIYRFTLHIQLEQV
ncbi:MAG: PilN domain-containing protein, partial [Desulfohalobiaceae bacterium]